VIRELKKRISDTASESGSIKTTELNKLKSKFVWLFQLKRLMDLNLNWMRCGAMSAKNLIIVGYGMP